MKQNPPKDIEVQPGQNSRRRVAVSVAVTALVTTVVFSGVSVFDGHSLFDVWNIVSIAFRVSVVLTALTLVARWLDVRHFQPWQQVVVLAGTGGSVSVMVNLLYCALLLGFPALFPEHLRDQLSTQAVVYSSIISFFDGDAVFGFWALCIELPRRISKGRRLEMERRALEQEAELARIRATLEPHFVLNTLHTISGLVVDEPRQARTLIADLGDLLRDSLEESQHQYRTVQQEVAWLTRFVRILESRHFGRLHVRWHLDPEVQEDVLPALLLQPLVENAVRHGALRKPEGGCVEVRITQGTGPSIKCVIEDDGPGFQTERMRAEGKGLDLVRRRLALEAPEAELVIHSEPGHTRVVVVLPRRKM